MPRHVLSSLTDREGVADALYRAMTGFDINDYSLFKSAFADQDAIVEIGQKTIKGTEAIRTQLYDLVAQMDTTHMITNLRIDIQDEASKAAVSALSLAQHCPLGKGQQPDGSKYTGGTMYVLDMVKDGSDGTWRIQKWVMKGIWGQGDFSVMQNIL